MPGAHTPGGPPEHRAAADEARASLAGRVGISLAGALAEQDVRAAAAGLALGGGVRVPSGLVPDAFDSVPVGSPPWDVLDLAGLRRLLTASPLVLVARNVGPVRGRRRTVVRFAEGVLLGSCTVHVTRADQPYGWDARVPVRIVFGNSVRAVVEALTARLVPDAQDRVGDASVVRAEQRLTAARTDPSHPAPPAEAAMLALALELSRSLDITLIGSSWGEVLSRLPGRGAEDVRWRRRVAGRIPVYRARPRRRR